jgi:DNA-binding SARP family transcriptional activator
VRRDIASTAEVTLLGGFRVVVPGRGDVTPGGVLAQMVKLLGVHGALHVEQLIELLWPDCDPETGRTRLRNVLCRLRRSCGDIVARDGERIVFVSEVSVDATLFAVESQAVMNLEGAQRHAMARTAVSRYRGDLLPFDLYADWAVVPRERLRRRYLGLLDLLAEDAVMRGDRREAVTWFERGIDVEPDDEDRYLAAARQLVDDGHRGRAVLMLRRARAASARLDLPPSAGLCALEAEIYGTASERRVPA